MNVRNAALCAISAILCSCGANAPTLDERIKAVKVVGTRVDESLRVSGVHELLVVPMDEHGTPLLDPGFAASAEITSPAGLSTRIVEKQCVVLRERQPLAMVIAVDDSSSMKASDPDDATGMAPGRKRVAAAAIDHLASGDVAALTDFYGQGALPLRDLVCEARDATAPCVADASSFTSDAAALQGGVAMIGSRIVTPMYEACAQAVGMLGARSEPRRALVLLSDGLAPLPARETCLDLARSQNVSIYTVGFGSGAEGDPVAPTPAGCPPGWRSDGKVCRYDAEDVQNLRELAEWTGGSYAPATDAARVVELLQNAAYSPGHCTLRLATTGADQIEPGMLIQGRVTLGNGATTSFEFLAPRAP